TGQGLPACCRATSERRYGCGVLRWGRRGVEASSASELLEELPAVHPFALIGLGKGLRRWFKGQVFIWLASMVIRTCVKPMTPIDLSAAPLHWPWRKVET